LLLTSFHGCAASIAISVTACAPVNAKAPVEGGGIRREAAVNTRVHIRHNFRISHTQISHKHNYTHAQITGTLSNAFFMGLPSGVGEPHSGLTGVSWHPSAKTEKKKESVRETKRKGACKREISCTNERQSER